MSDERDGRMWCWAPNPEASGIMGDVCDGCSDNEECMVGVLRERVADIESERDAFKEQNVQLERRLKTALRSDYMEDFMKRFDIEAKRAESSEDKLKNLEKFCEEVMMVSHDRRMKLDKVGVLPEKWYKKVDELTAKGESSHMSKSEGLEWCADDLESVLRGK